MEQVEHFEFSIAQHATFLDGYLDAVGRVLTTDRELCAFTARDAEAVLDGELVLGAMIRKRSMVENWSQEFGSLVGNFLRLDQRNRVGFYLIDYICWFEEFTENAECLRLECDPVSAESLGQFVYLLQLEGGKRFLLLFQRLDKTHGKRLQPVGTKTRTPTEPRRRTDEALASIRASPLGRTLPAAGR